MRMIGVDVGGTFTDIVFADTDSGRNLIHKVPTTPDDPARGVIARTAGGTPRKAIPPAQILGYHAAVRGYFLQATRHRSMT